jgi:hypothetical protein
MPLHFTPDLIAAANDWVEQSPAAHKQAEARLASVTKAYFRQLDHLKSRVSRDAWEFFRYGFGSKGLHDARLLSLQVGDGIGYVADGTQPFRINRQHASVVLEFLNYEQTAHYVFDLRRVKRLSCDLFVDDESYAKSIGDLYTYELTLVGDDLQLGLIFATGATIVAQFGKLVFRKQRLKPQYDGGRMYD